MQALTQDKSRNATAHLHGDLPLALRISDGLDALSFLRHQALVLFKQLAVLWLPCQGVDLSQATQSQRRPLTTNAIISPAREG